MPLTLHRPERAERLTDIDARPANTTTTLPRRATLSPRTLGHREIHIRFAHGEFVAVVEAEPPRWLLPTLEALGALFELSAGWDGYDSPSVQPPYVESALDVILGVMRDDSPTPSVVPTSRGGVQIEWHTRGVDLEVEFETPSVVRAFFEDHRTGRKWERDVSFDRSVLTEAIAVLSQRT